MKAKSKKAPFKVGDVVRFRAGNDQAHYTVSWTSKNATNRGDQLIATDRHGYHNPSGDASLYVLATES